MEKNINEKDVRQNPIEEKTDCFAYRDKNYCHALSEKKCKFCAFYKPRKESDYILTEKRANKKAQHN